MTYLLLCMGESQDLFEKLNVTASEKEKKRAISKQLKGVFNLKLTLYSQDTGLIILQRAFRELVLTTLEVVCNDCNYGVYEDMIRVMQACQSLEYVQAQLREMSLPSDTTVSAVKSGGRICHNTSGQEGSGTYANCNKMVMSEF